MEVPVVNHKWRQNIYYYHIIIVMHNLCYAFIYSMLWGSSHFIKEFPNSDKVLIKVVKR